MNLFFKTILNIFCMSSFINFFPQILWVGGASGGMVGKDSLSVELPGTG